MNIVCMCRGGNVRSVAAKMVLSKHFKHEVIATGLDNTNEDTKRYLFSWADIIVVMNEDFVKGVPKEYEEKIILMHVGPDRFGTPFHEELQLMVLRKVKENSELTQGIEVNEADVLADIWRYQAVIRSRNP